MLNLVQYARYVSGGALHISWVDSAAKGRTEDGLDAHTLEGDPFHSTHARRMVATRDAHAMQCGSRWWRAAGSRRGRDAPGDSLRTLAAPHCMHAMLPFLALDKSSSMLGFLRWKHPTMV